MEKNGQQGLSRKAIRAIEASLGVYLDKPRKGLRTSHQQFGVYDEDEVFVADIVADGDKFAESELVDKIKMKFQVS